MCALSAGGVDCYLLELPAGYGFQYLSNDLFYLDGEVNDVRQEASTRLTWWFEWAMLRTASLMQPITKLYVTGEIRRFPGLPPNTVAAQPSTLTWFSWPMRSSGVMVHIGAPFHHSHQGVQHVHVCCDVRDFYKKSVHEFQGYLHECVVYLVRFATHTVHLVTTGILRPWLNPQLLKPSLCLFREQQNKTGVVFQIMLHKI